MNVRGVMKPFRFQLLFQVLNATGDEEETGRKKTTKTLVLLF